MSHTPSVDSPPFTLRWRLAETTIGPAEMYELASTRFDDPDAVDALCVHATGSFPRLVGLYAAQQHVATFSTATFVPNCRDRFRDQVFSCAVDQCRRATETDLLEGLHTARTVFTDAGARPQWHAPTYISGLFAEHAPLVSSTARVAAEMSVRFTHRLSPELGLETRRAWKGPRFPAHRADQVVSRLLLSKFGDHAPSWDMFKQIHTPDVRIGDVVDLVLAVETSDS